VELDEGLEPVAAEAVLGEHVGRVHFTIDLAQVDAPGAHSLLDPQRMCVQMPKLA
jgi:hypothetical protein